MKKYLFYKGSVLKHNADEKGNVFLLYLITFLVMILNWQSETVRISHDVFMGQWHNGCSVFPGMEHGMNFLSSGMEHTAELCA